MTDGHIHPPLWAASCDPVYHALALWGNVLMCLPFCVLLQADIHRGQGPGDAFAPNRQVSCRCIVPTLSPREETYLNIMTRVRGRCRRDFRPTSFHDPGQGECCTRPDPHTSTTVFYSSAVREWDSDWTKASTAATKHAVIMP